MISTQSKLSFLDLSVSRNIFHTVGLPSQPDPACLCRKVWFDMVCEAGQNLDTTARNGDQRVPYTPLIRSFTKSDCERKIVRLLHSFRPKSEVRRRKPDAEKLWRKKPNKGIEDRSFKVVQTSRFGQSVASFQGRVAFHQEADCEATGVKPLGRHNS